MHLILKLDLNILNFKFNRTQGAKFGLDRLDCSTLPSCFRIEDIIIGVIYLRRAEYIVKQVNLKVGEQSVRITRNVMNNNMMFIANSYAKGPSTSILAVGFTSDKVSEF